MHASPRLRFVPTRAAVVGGIAAVVGVLGHINAGGETPDAARLALIWLLCSAFSSIFLLRPAGWLRLTTLLAVEQILVHVGLMALAMDSSAAPAGMQGMPGMSGMSGMSPMPGMTMPPMSVLPSLRMLLMHAVAAAVVGLWLWRGECALARLVTLAAVSLRVWWRIVVARPRPIGASIALAGIELRPVAGLRCAQAALRRGPPSALAC